MKKSVLLFVSLLLATVSAIAQPAKPEVTYSDWVEETDVYLYNVEAGMFLVGSNNWGTRACLIAGETTTTSLLTTSFLLVMVPSGVLNGKLFKQKTSVNKQPASNSPTWGFQTEA